MVASSLIRAAALVAAAVSTASAAAIPEIVERVPGRVLYKITTYTTVNPRFNGKWLQVFHTGAGENAVVGVPSFYDGTPYYFDTDTSLIANISEAGQPKFGFYLAPGLYLDDSAPKGYNAVETNIDQSTKGFYIGGDHTLELRPAFNPGLNFTGFELCYVKTVADNDRIGPDYQLLWKKEGTTVPKDCECADVELKLFADSTETH